MDFFVDNNSPLDPLAASTRDFAVTLL